MKKIFFALATVTFALSLFSCKKEKKEEDITVLFQSTIWTGEIKYPSNPFPEPYSVSFDGKGGLLWEDRLGTINGSYTLYKAEKAILLDIGKLKFKATINNRKFTDITADAGYYLKVYSGEFNDEAGKLLANSLWKGTQTIVPNTQQPFQMKFMTDQNLNFNGGPDNYPYKQSGVTLKLDFTIWGYYFVILPQNKIKGIFWDAYTTPGSTIYRSLDLTRQ